MTWRWRAVPSCRNYVQGRQESPHRAPPDVHRRRCVIQEVRACLPPDAPDPNFRQLRFPPSLKLNNKPSGSAIRSSTYNNKSQSHSRLLRSFACESWRTFWTIVTKRSDFQYVRPCARRIHAVAQHSFQCASRRAMAFAVNVDAGDRLVLHHDPH